MRQYDPPPVESLLDAKHDPIHPSSGDLIRSHPVKGAGGVDKTDIVWRLRANWSYLGREAADEITRLRAEVVALKEELSDVAAYAKACQSLLPATAASKMKETP